MKLKIIILVCAAMVLTGCQTLNSRFGNDATNYANATEMPQPKFPPGTVGLSNKYDIPKIPNEDGPIIAQTDPPGF